MSSVLNSPRLIEGGIALQYNPDTVSRTLQVEAEEAGSETEIGASSFFRPNNRLQRTALTRRR